MQLEKYRSTADALHTTYKFLSVGPKGNIEKVVQYQLLAGNLYNLAFGDWNESENRFNDAIRSNNDDKKKILATVAFTILAFIDYYPQSAIFVQGASPAKTRLYQMAINKNWYDIQELFIVHGLFNDHLELFRPSINYDSFVVELKRSL